MPFERSPQPASRRPRGPVVLGETCGPRSIERALRVPEDLAALEGHFPGTPLVAAVVQLGWVMDALAALAGRALAPRSFEGLRFRDVLAPPQELRLAVELAEAGDVARFQLDAGSRVFAAGRVRLAPEGPVRFASEDRVQSAPEGRERSAPGDGARGAGAERP